MRWEDCGTPSLGDKPAQLSRWNVPKKYAAYSGRAGNNALYLLSSPLLPSLPVISLNMCLSSSSLCFSEHQFLFIDFISNSLSSFYMWDEFRVVRLVEHDSCLGGEWKIMTWVTYRHRPQKTFQRQILLCSFHTCTCIHGSAVLPVHS